MKIAIIVFYTYNKLIEKEDLVLKIYIFHLVVNKIKLLISMYTMIVISSVHNNCVPENHYLHP